MNYIQSYKKFESLDSKDDISKFMVSSDSIFGDREVVVDYIDGLYGGKYRFNIYKNGLMTRNLNSIYDHYIFFSPDGDLRDVKSDDNKPKSNDWILPVINGEVDFKNKEFRVGIHRNSVKLIFTFFDHTLVTLNEDYVRLNSSPYKISFLYNMGNSYCTAVPFEISDEQIMEFRYIKEIKICREDSTEEKLKKKYLIFRGDGKIFRNNSSFNCDFLICSGFLSEDDSKVQKFWFQIISHKTGKRIDFGLEQPQTGDKIYFSPFRSYSNFEKNTSNFSPAWGIGTETNIVNDNIVCIHNGEIKAICALEENEMWSIRGNNLKITGIDGTRIWGIPTGELLSSI
jgi:hypothetical protein